MSHHRATAIWAVVLVLVAGASAAQPAPTPAPSGRVIVELALPTGTYRPEGELPAPAVAAQRRAIAAAADRVTARVPRGSRAVARRFTTVPYLVLEADAAVRAALDGSPDVVRVMD